MKYLPFLLLLLMPVLHAQTTFANPSAMRAAVLPLTDANAAAAITTLAPSISGNVVNPPTNVAQANSNTAIGITASAMAHTSGNQAAHDYALSKLDYRTAAHYSSLLNLWTQAVSEQTSRNGQPYGTGMEALQDKQHDAICLIIYQVRCSPPQATQAQLAAFVLNTGGTGLTGVPQLSAADARWLADSNNFVPADPTVSSMAAAYFNRLIAMLPNNSSNSTVLGYLKDQAAKYQ